MSYTLQHHRKLVAYVLLFVVLVASLFFAARVFAQTFGNALEGVGALGSIAIEATPAYPTPGEEVVFRVPTSRVKNADSALLTWTVNGEVVLQAYGQTRYKHIAGPVGSVLDVRVTIADRTGRTTNGSRVIHVNDVVIIWEGDTYTPPFFNGRALQSPGSEVRFLAIPHATDSNGVPYKPEELTYHWNRVGSPTPLKRGQGLSSVTLENHQPYSPFELAVHVKDPFGDTLTIGYVSVPVSQPEVIFYESDPNMGLRSNKALSNNYFLGGGEAYLYAEPYYMIASSRTDPSLTYTWTIGSQVLNNPGSIALRPEGAGSGVARVRVTLGNPDQWQQSAAGELSVIFTSNDPGDDTGLFGETDNEAATTPL